MRERNAFARPTARAAALLLAFGVAGSVAFAQQRQERSGQEVVDKVCAACHAAGANNNAPKIGDRAAWIPRLKMGLDALVASAIHGHGPMPARGGMAELSDDQIRGAIIAMFSAGVPPTPAPPAATAPDPLHRSVAGADVYLGVISADALRAARSEGRDVGTMRAGLPDGKGWYHVNISLADAKTHVPITDAEVTVKVAEPTLADTRRLELIAANNTVSYGNFFRMDSGKAYTITAQIRRPGAGAPAEARFDYKP